MTTLTDKTVIVLNTEESMYTLAANLLVSDGNHLTVTPATYNNATVSEATGTLTIERTNSNGTNNAWQNYYITGLADTTDPTSSALTTATPYYPSYLPNAYKYEVCVF